jgi:3-hydroxybutyryl-CoA dehydrogenase
MNLETILVIGAGTMGAGIAQVAARSRLRTILFDTQATALERAMRQTKIDLQKLEVKGKITQVEAQATLARLQISTTLEDAGKAQLVIEAASENLEVKHAIFRNLESHVSTDTLLATNTSTISTSAISTSAIASVLEHPERAVGLHFFNPATIMPLVEVIRAEQTSQQTLERVLQVVQTFGKTAVVTKDSPGFMVNRIARPFYLEALRMLEAVLLILQGLQNEYGEQYRPHPLLRSMVLAGTGFGSLEQRRS